ncbi:helix-turn-helix domain-containing protein [Gordonia amicalis]|uniref:Helix-turn-helix transcriptional regulator n=1 Tax=Gordonia amicalis TaxID=89053 RepID=A0ABU4DLN9_9ACTN|nr:helix-turn-helix transcriptional regulator [Gordonia amicalis]MDV6309946.1 helix-turn-helix transcriptional regulator [Gordonia amicalis]
MSEPSWWTYIRRIAGTETGRVIAEAAGVSEPQVSRWKTGKNTPDADKLVEFARYFNRPPLEALIAAGYIRQDEAAGDIEVHTRPQELSDEELLSEIKRRMEARHGLEADQEPRTPGEAIKDQKTELGNDVEVADAAMLGLADRFADAGEEDDRLQS